MLSELFAAFLRVPYLKKKVWRAWYQFLARRYRGRDWTFMNYGFHHAPSGLPLLPADEKDRCCIQLYNRVAGAVDLRGMRVLEVGCGRGGGASFIARYLLPLEMTGVDLSPEAVRFCRGAHPWPGLDFRVADAEHLPFADGTVDALVNVESSHCYPNLPGFFREVRRVLQPEGCFLYADLHDGRDVDAWRRKLTAAGLVIAAQEDITQDVLAALDLDDDRKRELIARLVPAALRHSFQDFAGMRGSKIYEGFRSGSLVYHRFVCRRS